MHWTNKYMANSMYIDSEFELQILQWHIYNSQIKIKKQNLIYIQIILYLHDIY